MTELTPLGLTLLRRHASGGQALFTFTWNEAPMDPLTHFPSNLHCYLSLCGKSCAFAAILGDHSSVKAEFL
jgi:hypothetical protein